MHLERTLTVTLLSFLFPCLFVTNLSAQAPAAPAPDFHPVLDVRPAAGAITIDGDLSDPGWANAARATGFVEVNPGDNLTPSVRSEAMITYTESHLYVAMIAWDDPKQVRASICDRDAIFSDDYFGILLDTYGDYAWGYELFINPRGIQGDLRLTSDGNEDISLDLVFESRGIVTDSGYQVELAIPFASLRFPNRPDQTWRMNFWRDRQRDNRFRYSWSAQSRDNNCFICQWGTLNGIKNVKPGSNLDILPNILAYQSGSMNNSSLPDSRFENRDPDADLSLNARYGLSTNSSVELAVNPDFSQVESDAGQIDVNETFALYYQERRPFFQEGSDLYGSYLNVIHTRTINDPIVAGKFTGQFGRFSIAYLLARDEHTPLIIPLRERSEALALEKSTVNILRGRQTLGQDSYIGFVLTDRRTDANHRVDTLYSPIDDTLYERTTDRVDYTSGAGSVYGIDGRFRFNQNLSFDFIGLGSHTMEPSGSGLLPLDDPSETFDYGTHTLALDGESFNGSALYAALNRGGRYWDCTLSYQDASPAFRADNGWITSNDRRELNLWNAVTFRPNRPWLVSWGPRLNVGRVFNYHGTVNVDPGTFDSDSRDEWFMPEIYLGSKGQTEIEFGYLASREWYHGQLFTGISRGFMNVNTTPTGWLQLGSSFEYGKKVARGLVLPDGKRVLGILSDFSLWGTLRPTTRLQIDPSYFFQKMSFRDNFLESHPDVPKIIYSVSIFRTRFNYQFSREWFLRLVLEYGDNNDSQVPNYLLVEPLLTYRINPFTKFYVGASWGGSHFAADYEFNRETTLGDGSIELHPNRLDTPVWRLERAQVFAKLQYLFRL